MAATDEKHAVRENESVMRRGVGRKVSGVGCRVSGAGYLVQGVRCRALGVGLMLQGVGCRV